MWASNVENQTCYLHILPPQLYLQDPWLKDMKEIEIIGYSTLIEVAQNVQNKCHYSNKKHTVNQSDSIVSNKLIKKDMMPITQFRHQPRLRPMF